MNKNTDPNGAKQEQRETALFAGGCFWCVEHLFDGINGIIATTSGYIGGTVVNPTYEQVCSGSTGHTEAVHLLFDPSVVPYAQLLQHFWVNIDPTTPNRQFCDVGTQYRAGIFYLNPQQKQLAETSKALLELQKPFPETLCVEITPASTFYPAETCHQDYHYKNPLRYALYCNGSGRAHHLKKLWGQFDPSQLTK